LSVLMLARPAEARHVRFAGPHPIAARFGGGFCYIETPHIHIYAPDHAALFQQVGDEYVFTGDPTPFGYQGEKHPFYGHHPVVTVEGEPVYCFIDGPHFHAYAPPEGDEYKIKNGVAFYVGPFSPVYVKMRPHRVRVVNAEYRPYVSFRPTVEVVPPPEWHGDVYVAGPSVEVSAPNVVVAAPRPAFVVEPPHPHVSVEVSAPGVFVAAPAPHVYVAPPAPHVYIAPPAPRVYVAPPAPVFVSPGVRVRHERDEDEDEHRGHEHHDNGRHRGWYK
jgi:hypothetical protein